MRRHITDDNTDLFDCRFRARVLGIQHADRVHEFLDANSRVIAEPEIEQIGDHVRSASLQTVNVDTGIEHQFLPGLRGLTEEG